MLVESEQWGRMTACGLVPDAQKVVIGTTCQVSAIGGPLQPTDLLCVS